MSTRARIRLTQPATPDNSTPCSARYTAPSCRALERTDQGEANAGAPNPYADQMRDMIQAWRTGWNNPPPLKNFSFILQQLSACTYGGDVPALRWSQQGAVSPWSTLENVAMTVGLDLCGTLLLSRESTTLNEFADHRVVLSLGDDRYDPESPCANVHIRNKTAVGERMALAARAITYNDPTAAASFTGPVASTFSFTPLSAPTAIVVGYAAGTTLPLQFRTINQTTNASLQGFEVQYGAEWVPASAEVGAPALSAGNRVTSTSGTASAAVTVRLPRGRPTGIRYAWESIPTTQLLFDSTLVSDTAGLHGLPAPPFWANCTAAGCRLVTPGFIPGHPPPPPPTPPTPPSPPFPPFCPEPPLPTDSTCTFYNQTTVTAAGGGSRVQVPLYGYAECCKACTAKPGCTAALLYHGPLRAEYDFCDLYTQPLARLNRTTVAEVCPSLSVVILPGSQ